MLKMKTVNKYKHKYKTERYKGANWFDCYRYNYSLYAMLQRTYWLYTPLTIMTHLKFYVYQKNRAKLILNLQTDIFVEPNFKRAIINFEFEWICEHWLLFIVVEYHFWELNMTAGKKLIQLEVLKSNSFANYNHIKILCFDLLKYKPICHVLHFVSIMDKVWTTRERQLM